MAVWEFAEVSVVVLKLGGPIGTTGGRNINYNHNI